MSFKKIIWIAPLLLVGMAEAADITIEMSADEQFVSPIKVRRVLGIASGGGYPARADYEKVASTNLELRCNDVLSGDCNPIGTCQAFINGTSSSLDIEGQRVKVVSHDTSK